MVEEADCISRPVADRRHRSYGKLAIHGAAEHNLKNIHVEIPLHRLVCVTGVSGSGKSTLVQDVLYNALCKLKHKPVELPGKHRKITGHEQIEDVVMVDQSPIGRTTRSNPASYLGAFDAIRRLFADAPLAKERSYTAGTFSFNSGEGRCPTCGGNGFEHVEMQFLSDVYLRCPDCDGKRYRKEVLEVKLASPAVGRVPPRGEQRSRAASGDAASNQPKSIADVLDMTVSEACEFFADQPEVLRTLAPLRSVGLGYVKLGQPVPTLSGGEAQRLKLAGHLAQTTSKRTLFLFDEPTTGLHFDDIATLLQALRHLLELGHSVVVIEHNLDVIRAADWIVDLGPEGGDAGGEIVCVGTPEDVAKCERSYTGRALVGAISDRDRSGPRSRIQFAPTTRNHAIQIHNAREHNLKSVDVRIPLDKFTVITGISGTGKMHAGLRYSFRRRTTALPRIAQRLRPAIRPTRVASRCGCGFRHSANGGDRTAHQPRRPQEHRGDRNRGLSLPAAAVRETRHPVLP